MTGVSSCRAFHIHNQGKCFETMRMYRIVFLSASLAAWPSSDQVEFVAGGSKADFSSSEAYQGTAFAVRERLVESFNTTMKFMK